MSNMDSGSSGAQIKGESYTNATRLRWRLKTHVYCGGSQYHVLSNHGNMRFKNNGYYECEICGYNVKSPELQDKDVLSDDDYRFVLAFTQMFVHFSTLADDADDGILSKKQAYLEEADRFRKSANNIRLKNEYKNAYDYKDASGNCIVDVSGGYVNNYYKETINYLTIGMYNGLYSSIGSLVYGYICPGLMIASDIISLVTEQMNVFDFGSFLTGFSDTPGMEKA